MVAAAEAEREALRQRRTAPPPAWDRIRPKVPSLLADLLVVLACYCALTALVPPLRDPLSWLTTLITDLFIVVPPNLAYAALIGLIGAGLRRRKRVAWWLFLLVICLPNLVWDVAHLAADWVWVVNIAIVGGLALLAILARAEFRAVVDKGNGWRALFTLVMCLGASVLIGYLFVSIVPNSLNTGADKLKWTAIHVFGGLASANTAQVSGDTDDATTAGLGLLGAVSLVIAASVLMRPRRDLRYQSPADEIRVRHLLAASGERDSLGYFATRRDKAVVFSASGKAAVTYRVVAGVSLASGDPIGEPEAWPSAVEAWLAEAERYAWVPAVMGASEEGAEALAQHGLDAVTLGDEAIVTVRDFSLEGRQMRVVRQAVSRVERAGYTCRIRRHAAIPARDMADVVARADTWRDTDTERGFSMALDRLGDPADGDCVLVECMAADGGLHALLSFVPWGHDGLSLDLMRRDRDADNGLVEFMILSLIRECRLMGVRRLSLNFAVFRSTFEAGGRVGAGPIVRLSRSFLLLASRKWQIESLYRANAKFNPEWSPRLVCFRDVRDLPRVGIASAVAEGFLRVPTPSELLTKGRRGREGELAAAAAAAEAAAGAAVAAGIGAASQPASATAGDAIEDHLGDDTAALPEQMRVRREKLARLREEGIDPYPVHFDRDTTIGAVRDRFGELPPDRKTGERASLAGRVMLNRIGGKLCFATVQDASGQIQVMLSQADVGEEALDRWKDDVDLGDHVGVTGEVVTSRRGELSVLADSWTLTAKCLRPLPDKHRGLHDEEARVRQRYVDLIVNPDSRRMVYVRSAMVWQIRNTMAARGFVEVETPILQTIHGGANARPFRTHINAYDMNLYLRIATELFLKKLAVGGMERVWELGRQFRNEGADASHNPEFTSMEAYEAYGDYNTMATLTRDLIQDAARAALGGTLIVRDGEEYDIGGEWPSVTVLDAISGRLGHEVTVDTPRDELVRLCGQAGVPHDPKGTWGVVVTDMYDHLVEATTVTPTFYRDFPKETSPLTRAHRRDGRLAERWDLVAFGAEMGTAYSELIDPVDQRARLTEQSLLAAGGDPEAMELDEDFLRALEYGMPPTGGMGLGIDRLVMILTGNNIRETILFPLVKPD